HPLNRFRGKPGAHANPDRPACHSVWECSDASEGLRAEHAEITDLPFPVTTSHAHRAPTVAPEALIQNAAQSLHGFLKAAESSVHFIKQQGGTLITDLTN